MITKFKTIKNLAVFQNFVWDISVSDSASNVQIFKDINVIYGRNYSGKTTLSRIVRALEQGVISDKYENPEFEVGIKDLADITQENLTSHGKKIRVFNEDFVKDNLHFIINPDESINPFAILGGNADLQTEIDALKLALGKNEEGSETGFYLELKYAKEIAATSKQTYESANSTLNQQLSNKATNNPNGIRYMSDRFGDQNYNISRLKDEIAIVTEPTFIPLTDAQVIEKDTLLDERMNQDVRPLSKHTIDIPSISSKAEELITKPISSSDKIEQLVKDAVLNRWVKDGRQHHKDKLDKCAFCGSDLTEERWKELDSHFDEESEKLERIIDALLLEIQQQIAALNNCLSINKSFFYSKYHNDIDRLIAFRQYVIDSIKIELGNISEQLTNRKNDLLNTKIFTSIKNNSKRLEWCWKIYENIRTQANNYSTLLGDEQSEAKRLLRLREVSDFANSIQYSTEALRIDGLKTISDTKAQEKAGIDLKIQNQIKAIEDKERLMNDEEKGALKVNEYLNNFFGNDFLTLKALEEPDQLGVKKIRFEIIRNGKKAHHLSEGECSLIAFCYFMAKLEDVETKGSKPIIWIDDPISSLDGNHIFFIYSLINAELASKNAFEQLFISTHNLDFLKYLKRLKAFVLKTEGKKRELSKGYFIVQRNDTKSFLLPMPNYLKNFVTEFNYLFHQIFKCSQIAVIDDSNYTTFYNFANNARKFLEIYLYYKFPDNSDESLKLQKFFGGDSIPTIFTERINNEYSHLSAVFERGANPVEVPEMKSAAELIIKKIKEKDEEQYNSLLLSIGVTP